jgi:hypothetical protein
MSNDVERPRAIVEVRGGGAGPAERTLRVGQRITFGRDRMVDIRFPEQIRLSRVAGSVRVVPDGVAITNLSSSHDLYVRTPFETVRLAATAAEQPVTSVLITGGSASVTWPGSSDSSIRIGVLGSVLPEAPVHATTQTSTAYPLSLNPGTKEFAVALFLCLPRLRAVPGETATPSVPELTRQILHGTNSFHLLKSFDVDREARTKLTSRVHEHLKSLRDKLVQAQVAPVEAALSPEAIADLLVDHNILRTVHLDLLEDDEWLSRQEMNWEK